MINNIIEQSYHKTASLKKKIPIEESEKSEIFHQIKKENIELSSLLQSKVKNADATINSNIDNLLSFSVVDSDNKKVKEQLVKFKKEILSSQPTLKVKKRQNKYLFKGDFSLSEKMKKTKIKEFSFLGKKKYNYYNISRIASTKNKNFKNIPKKNFKNNTMIDISYHPDSEKINFIKKNKNMSMTSDSFFITKVPKTDFFPNKTNPFLKNFSTIKATSKAQKLHKIQKLIKESNTHMLDIHNGLKDIKNNKIITFNSLISSFPQSEKTDYRKLKSGQSLRNIDKFINLHMNKNLSVSSVNRKFQTLFQKIFHNKRFSNEKLDARTIMDPLDKIIKGAYKEVRMDNNINNSLGQRIWIKKSTANIVSYGKSCQKISDDIFYKERKRLIAIYPKIEEEAKILVPKKKLNKRNPLFKKLIDNVNKINDVFLEEYNLLKRVNRRMRKNKI